MNRCVAAGTPWRWPRRTTAPESQLSSRACRRFVVRHRGRHCLGQPVDGLDQGRQVGCGKTSARGLAYTHDLFDRRLYEGSGIRVAPQGPCCPSGQGRDPGHRREHGELEPERALDVGRYHRIDSRASAGRMKGAHLRLTSRRLRRTRAAQTGCHARSRPVWKYARRCAPRPARHGRRRRFCRSTPPLRRRSGKRRSPYRAKCWPQRAGRGFRVAHLDGKNHRIRNPGLTRVADGLRGCQMDIAERTFDPQSVFSMAARWAPRAINVTSLPAAARRPRSSRRSRPSP